MSTQHTDELLTRTEVAEILRVEPDTVRRYAASGQLAVVRINARVFRYSKASVEALARPVRAEANDG
jgi:excisionase family DNA binding protein